MDLKIFIQYHILLTSYKIKYSIQYFWWLSHYKIQLKCIYNSKKAEKGKSRLNNNNNNRRFRAYFIIVFKNNFFLNKKTRKYDLTTKNCFYFLFLRKNRECF